MRVSILISNRTQQMQCIAVSRICRQYLPTDLFSFLSLSFLKKGRCVVVRFLDGVTLWLRSLQGFLFVPAAWNSSHPSPLFINRWYDCLWTKEKQKKFKQLLCYRSQLRTNNNYCCLTYGINAFEITKYGLFCDISYINQSKYEGLFCGNYFCHRHPGIIHCLFVILTRCSGKLSINWHFIFMISLFCYIINWYTIGTLFAFNEKHSVLCSIKFDFIWHN